MSIAEMYAPPAPAPVAIPGRLFTDRDLADLFGVNLLTIRKWSKNGHLPAPVVVGSRRYWSPEVIAKVLAPARGVVSDAATDAERA